MNYDWDIRDWVERNLRSFFRRAFAIAWFYALLKPLEDMHAEFKSQSDEIDFNTKYSSQQIVLAHLLNDLYDPTNRLIRVETVSDGKIQPVFYQPSENKPVYFYQPSEGNPVYFWQPEEIYDGINFRVMVPTALSADVPKITARVRMYALAGMRWEVVLF
jgi:hypothetical protein